ncbi:hypothetical protein RRG08_024328 [Elysia crispata]|uniref:Piezo-type mechanosensitive ion channel component n=1 Tax=Elysia crispata TaxID=231223 RepID=A0AAE0ZKR8_9GAST|nr:hypothetical protein RRG08_024328 [Elysia crispata]
MVARGHKFLTFLQFRIVLPLVLLSAAFLRYNAISLVYLLCLLVTPLLRIPSRGSMQGATGRFLRCMIPIGLLPVLGQIIFQVTLVALATTKRPYGHMLSNCSSKERLLRQIGFQRLDHASKVNILRLVVPDVIVLVTAIVTLVMAQRVFRVERLVSASTSQAPLLGTRTLSPSKNFIRLIMDFTQNTLLMAAGVIVPSIFGMVYFLVFLSVLTLWGCYKSMGRVFGFVRVILLIYTGSHIMILHLYQFQFFQDALDPLDLVARVLGLTGVVKTDCSDLDSILIHDNVRWSSFVNVGLLLALYWVLAFNMSIWRRRFRALRESQESISSYTSDRRPSVGQTQNETGSMVFSGSFNEEDEPEETESRRSLTDRSRLMDNYEYKEYGARKGSQVSSDQRITKAGAGSIASQNLGSVVDPRSSKYSDHEGASMQQTGMDQLGDSTQDLVKRKPWMSVIVLIMRQSYVLSLIAMMAWSITYHSWLTFALLLTACILWMMPNSRHACLRASPFVLIYAELLLMAGYIFNMNLKDELPSTAGTYKLAEVGLKRFTDPCLHLALQAFYTLFLVLTMRQYLSEVQSQSSEEEEGIRMQPRSRITFLDKLINTDVDIEVPKDFQKTTYDSKTMVYLGHFLWIILCKYWIVFCTVIMAVIALQQVFIYKIIYMFFFLIFIFIFQINFRLWRTINYAFWWLVIVYSMVVLIIIYTFQFEEFNKYWTSRIGISDQVLKDIGLIKYDTAGLFKNLLSPTSFLVFVILQVRYFHQPFLKLSDPDRFKNRNGTNSSNARSDDESNPNMITEDEEELPPRSSGEPVDNGQDTKGSWRKLLKKTIMNTSKLWNRFTVFMWRLGEIHIFKLVIIIIMVAALKDVSALTAVYVLVLAILLPFFRLRLLLSHLALLWTIIIILAKMIFQLRLVDTNIWKTQCDEPQVNGTSNSTEQNNAVWFGLEKVNVTGESISHYLQMYLVVLMLICLESIIRYHQKQHYNNPTVERPMKGIIFNKITRIDADNGLLPCIKFFANYFFYKFGLECCWVMTAILASVRCDGIALIYIALMGVLMVSSRRTVSRIWPIYKVFLAVILAIQFLVVLGFPRGACITYPWLTNSHFSINLRHWLFLPDYDEHILAYGLIADLLQLLLVCLQSSVFNIESNPDLMINYGGGDNKDIVEDVEANKPIPCEDFTIEQKKTIEVLKFLIFEHMFWVTMAIIFITGATRINIFSLFYVIAVFCFMWFGKEFFLKPLRSLLKMWNLLTGYCVFVIFCKVALQLVGCVYVKDLVDNGQCWLVQTFGVNCLLSHAEKPANVDLQCPVEKDDSGMAWDVVCLVFLLLQRRIYSSHYFRHVVDTIQAQNGLVSKGAELINRIMIREVNKQNALEKKVLIHIKEQMKALKKKQSSLKKDFKEPEEHFQAIRAGDYYLFEEDLNNKSTPMKKAPTTLDIGVERSSPEGPNPLQVIHTAHDQDMETATSNYEKSQQGHKQDSQSPTPEEAEEGTDEEVEPPTIGKLRTFLNFLCTIWYSIVDWIIRTCNRLSRNYRLVAKKLSLDLVQEKRKIVSSKIPSTVASGTEVMQDPVLVHHVSIEMEPNDTGYADRYISLDDLEKEDDEEMAAQFASNKDRLTRLFMAIGLLMASQSEMLCYLLMILDQMVYGSLLSLPLPLMVFLWGMLSVPRPSKTFWVTVITYIEAIVVCKYLFQFGFFPWNDNVIHDSPFYPPRIIGIEKKSYYANMDIALLLALFLHRSILRKYGLWRDSADISADLEIAETQEKDKKEIAIEAEMSKLDYDETEKEAVSKMGQGLSYVLGPFTKFFKQVTESSYNATTDVYAPMFFCDFILFLVLVFGFSSFGPAATSGDGDVATYIQDNKIPIPFIVMLILQFVFIVIDRGLFLRKNVLGKFIFQILLVIAIHIWMFFLLPSITERSFFNNRAAQLWYFIKCIYFGLSAYQIRCGYPTRILGNFLTKSYGILNMILFKGFLAIPFLLELRSVMDWMWTDSTLAIGNWLQMEDIYANIFVLKCWREIEKAYPQERSIKKNPIVKYISGGILLVIIIFIIWFPLVFFSFFNAVFISNPPTEATLNIGIGGYQPLFRTTALGESIRKLTDAEFNSLKSFYSRDRNAYSVISGYSASDITLVEFDGNSLSVWGINPPSLKKLSEDLKDDVSTNSLVLTMEVKFSREPDKALPTELSGFFSIDLRQKKYTSVRHSFASVINGTSSNVIEIPKFFPRFLRLASQSKAIVLEQLENSIGYSNITMELERTSSGALNEWWNLNELLYDGSVFHLKPSSTVKSVDKASFITFNDKKAPESLSFLSNYGIIGLYISFVVLVGRLLRSSTTNQYLTIMFRELPDVDKVLQLTLDIYLVREMKEFHLEEDLYAMLVFLYRSPDTMVKETRQTVRIGNIKKKEEGKKKKDD